MRDSRRTRIAAAAVAGAILIAAWPAVSSWWIGTLKAWVLPLSGGAAVYGPVTASPTLAAAVTVLLALGLPLRRRLGLCVLAVASTLALEGAVVLAIPSLGISGPLAGALPGIAQDVVPLAWLVVGVAAARSAGGAKGV